MWATRTQKTTQFPYYMCNPLAITSTSSQISCTIKRKWCNVAGLLLNRLIIITSSKQKSAGVDRSLSELKWPRLKPYNNLYFKKRLNYILVRVSIKKKFVGNKLSVQVDRSQRRPTQVCWNIDLQTTWASYTYLIELFVWKIWIKASPFLSMVKPMLSRDFEQKLQNDFSLSSSRSHNS